MNDRELARFVYENSSEPIIKNPVLRKALQPRLGFYLGKSVPSKGTIEDADTKKAEDALSGVNEVMKVADLQRQGHIGHFYGYGGKVKHGPRKGMHKYLDFYSKNQAEKLGKGKATTEWFKTKKAMNEALQKRKEKTGLGLTDAQMTTKYKKFLKKEGFKTWAEAPDDAKSRMKTALYNEKNPRESTAQWKKEGLSKRVNEKTRKLLETKKPINPKTGLPYTIKEYTDDLTRGQQARVRDRMQGKKRKDVGSFYVPGSKKKGFYPEKDPNRLINYMKIAAKQQEKLPIEERTFINIFDDKDKERFIGVKDVKRNTLYTHVDYNLAKEGAKKGTVITKHPDFKKLNNFFKVAKKFKYERPEKLLGSYFKDYEKVPTYNEIYNFFTKNRNVSVKTFQNNALTIQHQKLIGKVPTQNFQLLTNINNTKAAAIMRKYNKGEMSKVKANYELQKIGARQEGLGIAQRDITPEKGLKTAKRETIKLFEDAYAKNPNIVKDIAKKLNLAGFRCDKANGGVCNNPRAYRKSIQETMEKASKGDNAAVRKIQNLGKTMNKLTKAARLTGWGLLTEVGFAAPFAFLDYAKGANKDEIISNATFGLFGKSIDEQLREQNPGYGQAADLRKAYDKELQMEQDIKDSVGGYRGIAQNTRMLEDARDATDKALDPFLMPTPHLESGRYFDTYKVEQREKKDADILKEYLDRKKEIEEKRGILLPSTGLEAVELAGGGIASLPGVRQGPAPLSGPLPDGLPFVPNRVTKI